MTTAIGVLGAGTILLFFFLNQNHKLSQDNVWYDVGNLVGALLLVWYAYLLASTPFLVLNAVWATVSFKDIVFALLRRR